MRACLRSRSLGRDEYISLFRPCLCMCVCHRQGLNDFLLNLAH